MNWSHYQTAIFEAVRRGERSLRVKALAGSGKSTVLEECIAIEREVRPSSKVVLVSFNKDIEVAMNARLERRGLGKLAKTCHAVGLAAWRGGLGEAGWELKVDKDKVRSIVDRVMTWPEKRKYPQVGRLVGLAKQVGLVPVNFGTWRDWPQSSQYEGLVPDTDDAWQDLIDHYGIDPDEVSVDCARRVLAESVATAKEVVDFDDMLYIPIIAGVAFEQYDVVFVDEAQDLSGIQHEMISRMIKP